MSAIKRITRKVGIMDVKFGSMQKIYIAGAHSRARTLKAYLNYLYPEIKIEAFLVDDLSENPEEVDELPVRLIEEGLDVGCVVYLGTRGANHPKLMDELLAVGFTQIIPVTVELDIRLRNEYMRKFYKEKGKDFILIDDILPKG